MGKLFIFSTGSEGNKNNPVMTKQQQCNKLKFKEFLKTRYPETKKR